MAKRGPKRRAGVERYPSGQIKHSHRRGESEEEATATALEARVRRLWGVEAWLRLRETGGLPAAKQAASNPLLGSALGVLFHVGKKHEDIGISAKQYSAGAYFGWLYRANAKVRGWPSPNVRAIDYGAVTGGLSVHPEDSDEYIIDIRRKWSDMYRSIIDADRQAGAVFEILKRVLLENLGPDNIEEIGHLRIGLNAIEKARG